jgi:hypothetical protein
MIAVLERRFPFHSDQVTCDDPAIHLATEWWLVVRRQVWQRGGAALGRQLLNGRILVFEDIVEQSAGKSASTN